MKIRLTHDLPMQGMERGTEHEVIRQGAHSVVIEASNGFRVVVPSRDYVEADDGPED